MSLHLECVTLDAHDPDRLARFWAETLDYQIEYDSKNDAGNDAPEREIVLGPKTGSTTKLLIVEVHDEKKAKNRLHFDLRPENQAAEVARVEALGARRVDVGQGEQTWVVLADPEGNEFCILRARSPEEE